MTLDQIMFCVRNELTVARSKFPDNKHLLHAFTEEAGEVTKAFLDSNQGKCTDEEILKELIQVIAMAVRLFQEGDPDFPALKPMPDLEKEMKL